VGADDAASARPGDLRVEPAGVSRDTEALFVVGMHESGLGAVGDVLRRLGLASVSPTDGSAGGTGAWERLSAFNDELLAALGATVDKPALLPRVELWRRLGHRADEARSLFTSFVPPAPDGSSPRTPWAWADPRNTVLAPFWIKALGLEASVVLVHRRPADVARAVSAREGISFEQGLVLWDEYNRMAFSLWEERPGLIVGIESFQDDVEAGVKALLEYLRQFGVEPTDQEVASALSGFEGPEGPEWSVRPGAEVPDTFLVLDRVLTRADLTTSVDVDEMVREFSRYYDEDYYAHYGDEGDAPYRPGEPQWTTFFAGVAGRIAEEIRPRSVLDAGCAIGFLVQALRDQGLDAWGVDVSELAISQVAPSIAPYCSVASLTDEIDGRFDLVTIIEVIEHMPGSVAAPVIANITRHTDAVLFSSTPDGFEEATHINVHTPDHWARLFADNGFFRDFEYDATYVSPHAVLFRRGSVEEPGLITGYEQTLWRARQAADATVADLLRDRGELTASNSAYAEQCGALEQEKAAIAARLDAVSASLHELELRTRADALESEVATFRSARERAALRSDLAAAVEEAASLRRQVIEIEATRLFRLRRAIRRLLGSPT
jgi:2-polyprenyl-3-methyl-5-hydroxy-6-metoxy-1,4-benzoquinol methylase